VTLDAQPWPVRPGPADLLSASELWDAHARWWKTTFTDGADPEYAAEIVPLVVDELAASRRILDLGCGEGQIARALRRAPGDRTVVGIDPSWNQLANGVVAGEGVGFCRGAGEELPFADGSFDAVYCCLAIEHTTDADAVLAEVSRVLRPGGCFLLLINHPMFQGPGSGFVDDQILGEGYWRVGPYLTEGVTVEEVDPGVEIPFAHRPLSRYVNPLAARDLVAVRMYEPRPIDAFLVDAIDPDLEAAIPRLLAVRFEHRPPLGPAPDEHDRRG
jgi:SAM-dependent methyltransferase